MDLPDFTWREILPGDRVIDVGTAMMSVNEKYHRLMAGQKMDECLTRTAIKNLQLYRAGLSNELLEQFRKMPNEVPPEVAIWFNENPEDLDSLH